MAVNWVFSIKMKNTICLPHSRQIINTEHLAAAAVSYDPWYKHEPIIKSFLGIKFTTGYKRVPNTSVPAYRLNLWFISTGGKHLYIPYDDEAKRDADFKYLMQFATNE